ncbi:MAG: phasin family protein [Sphingomonadales bacterium]|nr:phasin family protein [Sphingomonadales bacterium]
MADATQAKIDTAKAEVAAEKAYAAAAAATPVKAEQTATAKPVEAKVAAPAKAVVAKQAAKPVAKKPAAPKKVAAKPVAARKTVKATASKKVTAAAAPTSSFKDTIMAKTQNVTEDFTAKVKDAMTEAQDRAKAAFEKSQALASEAGEFTKGNVEALVESGKVLAAGMQDLGKDYVAEAKTAFETVQADMKQFAAVKSPADFFKLQGEILRRNFDAAVASGSKNSEKVVKIAGEAFAPIQNRVSLAIEKVKKAA